MARDDRYTLGHVYQPTRLRQAYGSRPGSCWLAEQLVGSVPILRARDVPDTVAMRIAVPMPGGRGVRWVVACPRCGAHVARLYDVGAMGTVDQRAACRHCLCVRYTSQYAGRRPEAACERVEVLRRVVRRTRNTETRQRRLARVRALEVQRLERQKRHERRQGLAFILGSFPALIRCQARIDKSWMRIVRAALRESAQVRAQLAEHPDTPAWAAQVVRVTLTTDQPSEEPSPITLGHSVVSQQTLDDVRAQYVALAPARQYRKAG